jgi:hypothetical protein
MATAKSKTQGLTEAGFQHGRSLDLIWQQLKDQRRHLRSDVLKALKLKKGGDLKGRREDRLEKFKQHGEFPRMSSKYRWVTHDNSKWLAIELTKISN